jgi:hypothetical protein
MGRFGFGTGGWVGIGCAILTVTTMLGIWLYAYIKKRRTPPEERQRQHELRFGTGTMADTPAVAQRKDIMAQRSEMSDMLGDAGQVYYLSESYRP